MPDICPINYRLIVTVANYFAQLTSHHFCFLVDKVDAIYPDSQVDVGGVGPEALVVGGEQCVPIEWVVLDSRQVPYLGLELRLVSAIGLAESL